MNDPSGYTDKLTLDVLARIERRLGGEPLSPIQRTAVWNSAWEVIYATNPPTTVQSDDALLDAYLHSGREGLNLLDPKESHEAHLRGLRSVATLVRPPTGGHKT